MTMVCEPMSESGRQARRRYTRDMAISAVLYVGLVFAAAFAIRNLALPQWALIVLSLLPVAPALLMLSAYLIYTRAMDEFQRRLQSEALIVATGIILFASFAYGFLEEWADFPHVPLIWVFPAFSFVFGFTHIVIRARYK
jgi:hypothetical protein